MRPEVFRYRDHLVFLREWFAYRKASERDFSLRTLATQAGLASGYLPMVLQGKRVLTAKAIAKLAPFLALDANEQSFFEVLVILGTTDSAPVRLAALERMRRFQQYRIHQRNEAEVHEYLTHWYYVAIREMASLPDFKLDAAWVAERLRFAVPLAKVKSAIKFLLDNGYLEREGADGARPPEKALNCSGGIFRIALAKFHQEIFALASTSVEQVPSAERSIAGHTVSLSARDFATAQAIAQDALEKIQALGKAEKGGENIYHFEVALFPLTQKRGQS